MIKEQRTTINNCTLEIKRIIYMLYDTYWSLSILSS